jgi:hypothetical protein
MKRLAFAALVCACAFADRGARACSCVRPHIELLSPIDSDAAPLNARVRIQAPTTPPTTLVLRVHNGPLVPSQTRTYAGGSVSILEIVPSAPLAALTRFEIATIDPNAHPSTTVIGTFKTASAADTTAPRFDSLGALHTRLNAQSGGGTCSIAGPWIELTDMVAHDERPDAQLVYGVWAPNAQGVLDTQRQPDTLVFPHANKITIGQTSLCDPRSFTFTGSVVNLAVAAIDDAGNASRAIRFRADLTKNMP